MTVDRSFVCQCPEGTEGEACEVNLDDCLDHGCVHGSCVDDLGTYSCNCAAGYTGSFCDQTLEPPAPVFAELSFDMDMSQVDESFDLRFQRDIARALQIQAAAIVVVSKAAGSVIVTFAI